MHDSEREPKTPYFTPEVKRWSKIIGSGIAVLTFGGLVGAIFYNNYQHDKDVQDASAEGLLKGLGFDANKLPIEVTDGAKILRVSCDASETGVETITSPHLAFHLDDKLNAYLVMPPLADPDGQTYGDETVTEYPLQTAKDVNAFIGGALVDLCSSQN
jgi:hypothetical protein